MPAAACVSRHSKTLTSLNVHCSGVTPPTVDRDELSWSLDEFKKICKSCKHLQQLSCAWPDTGLLKEPIRGWRHYETAVVLLKKLITLNITTFPATNPNKPHSSLLPKWVYEQLLQGLAQRLFESARCVRLLDGDLGLTSPLPSDTATPSKPPGRLRLIAFGIADKVYECTDSKNQILYLRSKAFDGVGKEKVHATPITWRLRRFIEPCSDVLEFNLRRQTQIPCRDPAGDAGGGAQWNE